MPSLTPKSSATTTPTSNAGLKITLKVWFSQKAPPAVPADGTAVKAWERASCVISPVRQMLQQGIILMRTAVRRTFGRLSHHHPQALIMISKKGTIVVMNNTITGHEYQLQWTDFHANPPPRPGTAIAFTVARSSLTFRIRTGEEAMGGHVPRTGTQDGFIADDVQLRVFPDRNHMWSVTSAQTPALLAHEQGHYNIVGLIMQNLWYDLLSPPNLLTITNPDDLFAPANRFKTAAAAETWANSLVRAATAFINKLESNSVRDGVYDSQTNHGLNATVQGNWNRAFSLASSGGGGMRFTLALTTMGITIP